MSRTVWKPFMPFTIQILLPNLAQPKSSFRGFSELIGCRDRFTLHSDVYRIENCVLWIRNEVVSRFLGCLSINSTHKIISNLKIVDVTHKWQITDPIFIYLKPSFVCVSSGIDIVLLLFDVIASIRERRSQAYPSSLSLWLKVHDSEYFTPLGNIFCVIIPPPPSHVILTNIQIRTLAATWR